MTPAEIKAVILRLDFRRRHTETCRGKKKIGEWDSLPKRAVCAGPYHSCGVHSDSEFKRRATGKITLDAAKAVTRVRVERGDAFQLVFRLSESTACSWIAAVASVPVAIFGYVRLFESVKRRRLSKGA